LLFSFQFFDREHELFNIGGDIKLSWYVHLFDCLKEINNRTWHDLKTNGNFDAHDYGGMSINVSLENYLSSKHHIVKEQLECFQIRICSKSDGRLHGFIIRNTFYIVWIDKWHNMSNSVGYEGPKSYKRPCVFTEYENEIKKCKEELNEINNIFTEECGEKCPHLKR